MERRDERNLIALYATFKVKQTFKGVVGTIETVKFGTGDCDPKIDKIGGVYFVYREPYERNAHVANYTHLLTNSDDDLAFAKRVDPKHSVFRISGLLSGLSNTDLDRARVYVNDGRTKKPIRIRRNGWYEHMVKREGSYKVTIILPIAAAMIWEQLHEYSAPAEGKSITYEVEFRPNGCDMRQLNVSPK
jgi:hypothetical protein